MPAPLRYNTKESGDMVFLSDWISVFAKHFTEKHDTM